MGKKEKIAVTHDLHVNQSKLTGHVELNHWFNIWCPLWDCVWGMGPGGRLNIKMSSYQYRDSHVKDKTVSPTVLSLTWESPYLGKTVFILNQGPGWLQSFMVWWSKHRLGNASVAFSSHTTVINFYRFSNITDSTLPMVPFRFQHQKGYVLGLSYMSDFYGRGKPNFIPTPL